MARIRQPSYESSLLVSAFASLLIAGCTALSDFSVHQCTLDADCDLLEGINRCDEGRCVPGCSSNDHCDAADPRRPICPAPGAGCASLLAEENGCYLSSHYDAATMGALTGEGMTIIGAFAPTFRSSLWLTLELAMNELNASVAAGGEVFPPILIELCSDGREHALSAVQHLARGLGARAVIASLEALTLRSAFFNLGEDDRTLFLSPYGTASALEDFEQDADRLWYLGPRYVDAAPTYEPALDLLLSSLAARGVAPEAIRIVSLVGASNEDKSLAEAVRVLIRVGSNDADSLLGQNRFRTIDLSEESAAARSNEVDQISNFAPHILLVFASGTLDVSEGLERASVVHELETKVRPGWQPLYLFGPRNVSDASLRRLASSSEAFRRRAMGVSLELPLDSRLAPALDSQFRTSFPNAVTPESALSVSYDVYDALYMLLYALAVQPAGAKPSRVLDASAGLARITRVGERVVYVGPTGLVEARGLLREGSDLDATGVRGPVRFDPATHARAGVAGAYCWSMDGSTTVPTGPIEVSIDSFRGSCGQEVLGGLNAGQ